MLHGLYWLLNNVADDAPVALCVDDLHWADTESLRFLNFLAPRPRGGRGGGPWPAPARVSRARTSYIAWRPLRDVCAAPTATDRRGNRAMLQRRLGAEVSAEFAAACREATGGNPFLLEALLRRGGGRGVPHRSGGRAPRAATSVRPPWLERSCCGSPTPPTATALVRAIAVLGDGASITEAAELAELSVAEAARAADRLGALEILEPAEGLEFAHPIVREAIYADIGAGERAIAHARAADPRGERCVRGADRGADRGDGACRCDRAGRALRRVAADALARGAPAAAATGLRRALAEPPPPELEGRSCSSWPRRS